MDSIDPMDQCSCGQRPGKPRTSGERWRGTVVSVFLNGPHCGRGAASALELPSRTLPGTSFIKTGAGLSRAIPCLGIKAFPLVNGKQEASPEGEREHQPALKRPGGTAASPLTPRDLGKQLSR